MRRTLVSLKDDLRRMGGGAVMSQTLKPIHVQHRINIAYKLARAFADYRSTMGAVTSGMSSMSGGTSAVSGGKSAAASGAVTTPHRQRPAVTSAMSGRMGAVSGGVSAVSGGKSAAASRAVTTPRHQRPAVTSSMSAMSGAGTGAVSGGKSAAASGAVNTPHRQPPLSSQQSVTRTVSATVSGQAQCTTTMPGPVTCSPSQAISTVAAAPRPPDSASSKADAVVPPPKQFSQDVTNLVSDDLLMSCEADDK